MALSMVSAQAQPNDTPAVCYPKQAIEDSITQHEPSVERFVTEAQREGLKQGFRAINNPLRDIPWDSAVAILDKEFPKQTFLYFYNGNCTVGEATIPRTVFDAVKAAYDNEQAKHSL